jgi:hypothetical protein
MKSILLQIRSTLTLEASVRYVDKMISGSCSVLWISLAELDGRHLRRYGEVPPGLAEYLDPQVDALNEHLKSIADLVGRKGSR